MKIKNLSPSFTLIHQQWLKTADNQDYLSFLITLDKDHWSERLKHLCNWIQIAADEERAWFEYHRHDHEILRCHIVMIEALIALDPDIVTYILNTRETYESN